MCLGSLAFRRARFGAELGGKMRWPFALLFFTLWLFYVLISSLEAYGHLGV